MELLYYRLGDLGRLDRRPALMQLSHERFRPARTDWLQAAGIAAALFVLYALTAPRSVILEDDALFILSSYYLGVEHPPGYPLFTLVGHLFTLVPVGSVAYRVHLASALFGALSGAALWMCARVLVRGRLAAALSAVALGASPVFWSQSIIADVYTLNTFFFLVLVYLGLRVCPPDAQAPQGAEQARLLAAMALVFGLSLSNHWPLMLLAAPAFVILLWPLRLHLLRRSALLLALVAVGLLPYAWMVGRSWMALPISFAGPLESAAEIWAFVSRAGYAEVDQSRSANWLDRIKFFRFMGAQLLLQFAVIGTLLAGVGFAVQWRAFGRRIAAFLTLAFLAPSALLLLLLGFDYNGATKHVFHVYPLPAYAVAALWMGAGFVRLAERYALRRAQATTAAAALLALILALGARINLTADHEWVARYAQLALKMLPENAVLFGQGEADLAPLAYFHMIENWRPDVTLYQSKGLILGNRLFHPLRTSPEVQQRMVRERVERDSGPVAFTPFAADRFGGHAQRDRWLHIQVDRTSPDPARVTVEVPEEAVQFFEESLARGASSNGWIADLQAELRLRYATLLARSLPRGRAPGARERRHLELLAQDFHGALGIAQGMMVNAEGYSVGAVAAFLDKARALMPGDASKGHQSHYFYLRGTLRAELRDHAGALRDFETAWSLWPVLKNPAIERLERLYDESGKPGALQALDEHLKRLGPKL